jgi:hypothetical protein
MPLNIGRIYSLLQDKAKDPTQISSLLCRNCNTYTTSNKTDIMCSECTQIYCRKCSHEPHPLTECGEILSKEDKEHMEDSYTACPGCKQLIDRSDACIHMRCTQCRTEFCHLCGEIWNNFDHIFDGLCSEVAKYPRLKEYIPIIRRLSSIINISKPQIRALQKYPKLLEYLIESEQSIMILGDTPEKLKELKEIFSNTPEESTSSNSAAGGGGI